MAVAVKAAALSEFTGRDHTTALNKEDRDPLP